MKKKTLPLNTVLVIWTVLGSAVLLAPALASESSSPQKLIADFEMTRTITVLSDKVSSTGKLSLGGPGLLRWETIAPSRSLLVVNRSRAWIRYPDLNLTRQFDIGDDPVMHVLSDHLFALTGGQFKKLEKWYEVKETVSGTKLVPKQGEIGRLFREITVSLGGADGVVKKVTMMSTSGDVTVIVFKNVRVEPSLSPEQFRLSDQ